MKKLALGNRWFTSDFVLDETATRLRGSIGAVDAVRFVQTVLASRLYTVLPVDADTFEAALRLMVEFADHPLSLTDCSSFALMQSLGIGRAFGFDADFEHCGFELLPGPGS